jgi:hypothetical protein
MERGKAGSDNDAFGRREGECPVTEIAGCGVPLRDLLADRLVVVLMLL